MSIPIQKIICSPGKITGIMLTLLAASVAVAQDREDPPAATEIICFAAQEKWVCAPADQKQQAHDKALRLAKEQPNSTDNEYGSRESAAVQTMSSAPNFDALVEEQTANEPNSLGADPAEQDFLAREDSQPTSDNATTVSMDDSTENEAVAEVPLADQSNQSVADNQQTVSQPIQQPEHGSEVPVYQTAPNDFDHWQLSYASQWTFQVVGTSNRHQLDEFVSQHGLQDSNYTIAKTQANGADWWVVLTGLYASREEALSQRSSLPSELAEKAWVRQIKTIQGEADK